LKINLLTHNDLDGIGCHLVTELVANELKAEYKYISCGYNNISEKFQI